MKVSSAACGRYLYWIPLVLLLSLQPTQAQTVTQPPPSAVASLGTATDTPIRIHAFISGKVQGVGFRNFTDFKATTLNLKGWVTNLKDGRVELVVEGRSNVVEKLMQAVSKGPSGAKVEKVDREQEPFVGEFKRFETLR